MPEVNFTGVTTETFKKLVLDAGAVYKNWGEVGEAVISATRGGNEFTVEREIRTMEVDNVHGPVKGARRITGETVRIVANFIEFSLEMLLDALPGTTSTYNAEDDTYTIRSSGEIADGDYITNIALVGKDSGTGEPVVCVIKNALATSGLSVKLTDKNEAVVPVTFEAHYDPAALATVPWEIILPNREGS